MGESGALKTTGRGGQKFYNDKQFHLKAIRQINSKKSERGHTHFENLVIPSL